MVNGILLNCCAGAEDGVYYGHMLHVCTVIGKRRSGIVPKLVQSSRKNILNPLDFFTTVSCPTGQNGGTMPEYHTRIRQLMAVRNVTQATLIRSTGIPRATITRLLAGDTEFSINQLELVSTVLGLSINDVVSPLKFDIFSLTGITKLDDLIRRLTALRSIPYDSKAHDIYSTTHIPDALCYSSVYARWNNDDRPCPKIINSPAKTNASGCTLHEHPKIDGLYGISVIDELSLNNNVAKDGTRNIYFPLRASVTGTHRMSVTTQMFSHAVGESMKNKTSGSLSQDEYVLTSSVRSIKNHTSDAIINHKIWTPIPEISKFVSERSAFEKYVDLVVN